MRLGQGKALQHFVSLTMGSIFSLLGCAIAAHAEEKPSACTAIRDTFHKAYEADNTERYLTLYTKGYVCVMINGKRIGYEDMRRSLQPDVSQGGGSEAPYRERESGDYHIIKCSVRGSTAVVDAVAAVVTTLFYPKTHHSWLYGYNKPIVEDIWIKKADGWAIQHRRVLAHNSFYRSYKSRPSVW